jgi:hypothetical protein
MSAFFLARQLQFLFQEAVDHFETDPSDFPCGWSIQMTQSLTNITLCVIEVKMILRGIKEGEGLDSSV